MAAVGDGCEHIEGGTLGNGLMASGCGDMSVKEGVGVWETSPLEVGRSCGGEVAEGQRR